MAVRAIADCGMRNAECGLNNPPFAIRNPQCLRRAQGAIEYAVLLAIVVAALVGMSIYMKRALSGKWRAVGDGFGFGRQYEPRVTRVQ